jgi:hypothetical protein
MQTIPENSRESSGVSPGDSAEPNFDRPPKPISELIARPDFPECAQGEFVDIGGYAGVVIEFSKHSIRVRSPEKTTQGFNVHVLRRLYGPREHPPMETPAQSPEPPVAVPRETPAPVRKVVTEPNFDRPARPIAEFAGRTSFPQNVFNEFVEISGFKGVVIEIVNQSLKVRSPQGITRSYGVSTLRSLYGRG